MIDRHLLLRGDFLHASLYFGHLTVVAYNGEVLRIDVPWLSTFSAAAAGTSEGRRQSVPDPSPLPASESERLPPPSSAEILTLHDYDGVSYFGGEDGLWALAEKRYAGAGHDSVYLHVNERPALDVDTTFGVGAVAHGDGVSVFPLGSSWLADNYFRPSSDELDSPAYAVTWAHHDLLSRHAPLRHDVIPATFELRARDDEKHYVFQGFGDDAPRELRDGGQPLSAVAPRSYATWEPERDLATLFRTQRFGWRATQDDDGLHGIAPSEIRRVGAVNGRVISLREFGSYLVCELSERLSAVDDEGNETVLLDHPATDIRVYPRSRRYRGIVTAVSERGVHVLELARVPR